jgi:hypothetical protein
MDEREERDEHTDDTATTEPGGHGPGRDSAPGSSGEPLTEDGDDAGTDPGTPGQVREPGVGGPNEAPRREQPGL